MLPGLLARGDWRRGLLPAAYVLALAWFLMSFYMDNSNDSETLAYTQALYDRASGRALAASSADAGASVLTTYLAYPAFAVYRALGSGVFLLRGFVLLRLVQCLLIFGLGYAFYRRLGFGRLATLFGLTAAWWSLALVTYDGGWNLDTYNEVILLLAAGIALVGGHLRLIGILAAVAGLMREVGALVPLLVLVAGHWRSGAWWDGQARRQVAAAGGGYLLTAVPIALLTGTVPLAWRAGAAPRLGEMGVEGLALAVGWLGLWLLLALASLAYAPPPLRRLLLALVPLWLLLEAPLAHLSRGARLAPLVLVVLLPAALYAIVSRGARASYQSPQHDAVSPRARAQTTSASPSSG